MQSLLSIGEAAQTLAVSERTVARLCAKGDLPAYRVGRQWRIGREDFLRWLRQNRVIPPLCRGCEQGGEFATGYSWRYRYKRETTPDKRILSQIRALADQLQFEASRHART